MLPVHQLQGELAISVPRHRHLHATLTAGKGWGICRFTHTSQACRARPRSQYRGTGTRARQSPRTVFFKSEATLALNDLFEYFVLPKALKPY